jgi:hypothetical protein
MIGLGTGVFNGARRFEAMVPSQPAVYGDSAYKNNPRWLPPEYPRFNAFVYSMDLFLPIIDLQQEAFWRPQGSKSVVRSFGGDRYTIYAGSVALNYARLHVAIGWALSTLLVAALTGIIKKD